MSITSSKDFAISDNQSEYDYSTMKKVLMKIIILGDVNVGKTNIVRRLLGQGFIEQEATVGVEFGFYEALKLDENVNLTIQLWDTCKILN